MLRRREVQMLVLGGEGRRGGLYSLEPVGVTLADLTSRTLYAALRIGDAA